MKQYEDEKHCSACNDVAITWYKKATANGNRSWLEQEEAGERNQDSSYYRAAFEKLNQLYSNDNNNGFLMQKLGEYYQQGKGCSKNDEKAKEFYDKAFKAYKTQALKGEAYAKAKIGDFFYKGKGCEQSNERAIDWYEKAAKIDSYFQYKLNNMKSAPEKQSIDTAYDAIRDLKRNLAGCGI